MRGEMSAEDRRECELLELWEAEAADLARDDLRVFVRRAWREVDNAEYLHNWHVDCICDHLMAVSAGEIQYLGINIPPGFSKSLIVSVFWPAWEWARRPELQYQAATHNRELATRDSVRCRDLIKSRWYQTHYGQTVQLKGDANGKTLFYNTARGWRRIATPGGKSTGWRSHRLIIDDLVSAREVHSDAKREAANDWLRSEFWNRRHEVGRDPVVMIGQRLHHHDPFGMVEEVFGGETWEHLVLPNRYSARRSRITWHGWDDPREEGGAYLHEARHGDAEDEEARRTLGEAGYAAQHDQDPTPEGGLILNPDRVRRYALPPHEEATTCDRIILSADCTFKDADTSDFVCLHVLGQRGSDVLLLEEDMRRMGLGATIEALRSLHRVWAPLCPGGIAAVLVEDKANGSGVIEVLRRELMGVIAVNPLGGKVARAHAVAPSIDAGNLLYPGDHLGMMWCDPTGKHAQIDTTTKLARLGRFPKLAHDDDIDATTQGIAWLLRGDGWSFSWVT